MMQLKQFRLEYLDSAGYWNVMGMANTLDEAKNMARFHRNLAMRVIDSWTRAETHLSRGFCE